jgi:hypothetical protein
MNIPFIYPCRRVFHLISERKKMNIPFISRERDELASVSDSTSSPR